MRAIILAAGRGTRLASTASGEIPKCLLQFGGKSLLQRHLENLQALGVGATHLVTGYQEQLIRDHVAGLGKVGDIVWHSNSRYMEGSVISLLCARQALDSGEPVLIMDADVLYDPKILAILLRSRHSNCFLLDRGFIPGDEPVKICLRNGMIVEFRKQVAADLDFDTIGESVGFFKFSAGCSTRLGQIASQYDREGRGEEPHEEALRDLVLEGGFPMAVEDVDGLPWIEIDFPGDLKRAAAEVLPAIG